MINDHLRQIREFEAQVVLPWLPSEGRLLEIGAGAGWQALIFATGGLKVFATELTGSEYLAHASFPIIRYDGDILPFPDASFDVVYSSNVLEHIPNVARLLREAVRVLRPDGRMIHVLPTPAWRLATDGTHYVFAIQRVLSRLLGSLNDPAGSQHSIAGSERKRRLSKLRALFPARHGETGNWFTEPYYFSRRRWEGVFRDAGLKVEASRPVGLFYTGYSVADSRLSLTARRRLSTLFGSACRLFVLRRAKGRPKSGRAAPASVGGIGGNDL
jgi:SAM-dependent methyltransferase